MIAECPVSPLDALLVKAGPSLVSAVDFNDPGAQPLENLQVPRNRLCRGRDQVALGIANSEARRMMKMNSQHGQS